MNDKKIIAYLGCRKGSQRVKNKNSRPFYNNKSLFDIKIQQLLNTKNINQIFFSTDDENLINICKTKYLKELKNKKIILHEREPYYASSECSGKEYQEYIYNILGDLKGHILWTHTTSPFIDENKYDDIIDKYFKNLGKNDSLMTVKYLQNYIIDKELNLINNKNNPGEAWPATQELETLYEVDSGAFIVSTELMKKFNNRIGKKPFLYNNEGLSNIDIDYEHEFQLAKNIWAALKK